MVNRFLLTVISLALFISCGGSGSDLADLQGGDTKVCLLYTSDAADDLL